MADHAGVAGAACQVDRLEGFGERSDLVHLDQDRVGHAQVNAPLQPGRVGHEQVVAHQLHGGAQFLGEQGPAIPVVFGDAVLDRHDREAAHQLGELVHHFGAGVAPPTKVVAAVFEELGAGHIEGQGDLVARPVAGFLDGLDQQVTGGVVAGEVGGKAAFVAHRGGQALVVEQALEGVEHFGAHPQGFPEAVGAMGHQHEFLEIHVVGGVGAAIDDVHQGHRQQVGHGPTQVAVEGQAHAIGGCPGGGQAHGEHRIGPQARLVITAIQLRHGAIHGSLVEGAQAAKGWGDALFDVVNRLGDALAEVAASAIAQFVGLVGAGASAAGNDRPSAGPTFEQHFGFNGGGPAGIEDLPGHNGVNYKVEGVEHEGAPSSCPAGDPMGHPRPPRCANGHR